MKKITFEKEHPVGIEKGTKKSLAADHAQRLFEEGYVTFDDKKEQEQAEALKKEKEAEAKAAAKKDKEANK
jgi:hypothetical protein